MNIKTALYGLFLVVCVGAIVAVAYDILFSAPTAQEGTITELVNIPPKAVSTYTPLRGRRIGDHAITVAKEEQWIAIISDGQGNQFQVHCSADHYKRLAVGDKLRYKKYEGELFHIRYFAHYEDH